MTLISVLSLSCFSCLVSLNGLGIKFWVLKVTLCFHSELLFLKIKENYCDLFIIETVYRVQQEIKLFAPRSLGKENKLNPAGEALMDVHHSDKHWWRSLADSIDDCPSNCFGNGDCVSGNCHCFPGFRGPDCSRGEICVYLLLH